MTEKEALLRAKTGNFNGGYGFDMQLLVDTVGIIGEMFNSGQICEVIHCKDCKHGVDTIINGEYLFKTCGGVDHKPDWFCADAEGW